MNKTKSILMLLLTVVLVIGSTVCTYAAEANGTEGQSKTYDGNAIGAVAAYGTQLPGVIESDTNPGIQYDSTGPGPSGKTCWWQSGRETEITSKANALSKQEAGKTTNQVDLDNFHNVTEGMALKADTEQAYGLLSGFTGVIKVLLGIIVVIVSVGMTVYSGFDLCYIAFPVFRNSCEAAKQGHGGGMMGNMAVKQGKNGENQLRFVSDDAQYAVTAAETVATGQNPFIIYFKKRFVSYLVLAVLLFILLTGKITVFTDIALKLTQGIINAVQGI